jgi:hypothetical protein
MKKFNFAIALCACLFVTSSILAQTTTTQTVVIGFEEAAPLTGYSLYQTRPDIDSYWTFGFQPDDNCDNIDMVFDEYDNELAQITYISKDTTFQITYGIDELTGWEIWSGIGLSTKTTKSNGDWWEDGNDALSTTSSGYNNSETYAVVFGTSWIDDNSYWDSDKLPRITLPPNATLKSIAIANLQYTVDSMNNGDDFTDPLGEEDNFDLIIYGIGKDNLGQDECKACKTISLFELQNSWEQVNFCSQWSDVTELRFAFNGSSVRYDAFNNPVYFAFDDLTFELPVPEED